MPKLRRWYELPVWGLMVALVFCGSAFIALSFHPALQDKHERGITYFFFYGGLLCVIGTLWGTIKWIIAIRRGKVRASDLSKSTEQIGRDADQALKDAEKFRHNSSDGMSQKERPS
jgi:hypothetical protein